MEYDIQKDINDSIRERPEWIEIGNQRLAIYPATLGHILATQDAIRGLGMMINGGISPFTEALRVVREKRKDALYIIAVNTLRTGDEVNDPFCVSDRVELLGNMDDEDIASALVACLSKDNKVNDYEKHFGIDVDHDRRRRVMAVKKSDNTFSFGGKSIYGTIIDAACQRYSGWTFQYVVWGISYTNLLMMMSDQISSIFLTDEERKNVHVSNDNDIINMDDPSNNRMILEKFGRRKRKK